MELILKRIAKRKSYTIGKMYIQKQAIKNQAQTPSPLPLKGEGGHTREIEDSPNHSTLPLEGERGGGPGGGPEGGLGLLYFCDTLEPTWRDYAHGAYKMKGHSAIPEGRYPVVVTWSPKFQQWLPLLLHVPKFEGIRIHAGNTPEDTEGCILLGENREMGKVLDSRRYVNLLKRHLSQRPEGEPVHITIE